MAGTVTKNILQPDLSQSLFCCGPFAGAARYAAPPPEIAVNRGVVELETGRAAGISVRIAEDLANVIDDGATRRVLPVVGKGSLQNIIDLKLLRGIDMAIVQADVLDYARQQNSFPGSRTASPISPSSITRSSICWRARDIKSVADLASQKVNVDLRGAGTAVTAGRLFALLKITVTLTNDDQERGAREAAAQGRDRGARLCRREARAALPRARRRRTACTFSRSRSARR